MNTIGPAAGRFENLTDEDWADSFRARDHVGRPMRAGGPAASAPGGVGPHSQLLGSLDPAPERDSPRLHGVQGGGGERVEEPREVARPRRHPREHREPGTIVTASFTEALHDVFVQRGLNSSDPYDVMRWIEEVFHQPADLGRAGLAEEVAAVVVFLASRRNGYVTEPT